MKKLAFVILTCVAAMSAKAQVLTSKTMNNVYEAVTNQTNSDYAFNAEWNGDDITTMFVYKKECGYKGVVTLKPHRKYVYSYAADGTLTSRIAYHWVDGEDGWICAARHDYALVGDKYYAEYSRYNHSTNNFSLPVEQMVYQLIGDTPVTAEPLLLAEK